MAPKPNDLNPINVRSSVGPVGAVKYFATGTTWSARKYSDVNALTHPLDTVLISLPRWGVDFRREIISDEQYSHAQTQLKVGREIQR